MWVIYFVFSHKITKQLSVHRELEHAKDSSVAVDAAVIVIVPVVVFKGIFDMSAHPSLTV
jgi:hypothetical protein